MFLSLRTVTFHHQDIVSQQAVANLIPTFNILLSQVSQFVSLNAIKIIVVMDFIGILSEINAFSGSH